MEDQVEKWIDELWEPLKNTLESPSKEVVVPSTKKSKMPKIVRKNIPDLPPIRFHYENVDNHQKEDENMNSTHGPKRNENAHLLQLIKSKWLTSPESKKQNIEVTFLLPNDFPEYLPGDSIGFYCANPNHLIDRVLARINYMDGLVHAKIIDMATFPSHLQSIYPTTVRNVLKWLCDLTSVPTKRFLRLLAEYCEDNEEKETLLHLCSIKGKEKYQQEIERERPTVADLLEKFSSCKPPADHLISCLPPLAPRYYSFASASVEHGKIAKFIFSIANFVSPSGEIRHGICTHWFCNLSISCGLLSIGDHYPFIESEQISINDSSSEHINPFIYGFLNQSKFHLPEIEKLSRPRIMIGPGTGVAPFIGFLEFLHHEKLVKGTSVGNSWLFFGCRNSTHDYLYREKLEDFERKQILHKLVTAFSRETANVVYVQHRLEENAEKVSELIFEHEGYIYICG